MYLYQCEIKRNDMTHRCKPLRVSRIVRLKVHTVGVASCQGGKGALPRNTLQQGDIIRNGRCRL